MGFQVFWVCVAGTLRSSLPTSRYILNPNSKLVYALIKQSLTSRAPKPAAKLSPLQTKSFEVWCTSLQLYIKYCKWQGQFSRCPSNAESTKKLLLDKHIIMLSVSATNSLKEVITLLLWWVQKNHTSIQILHHFYSCMTKHIKIRSWMPLNLCKS